MRALEGKKESVNRLNCQEASAILQGRLFCECLDSFLNFYVILFKYMTSIRKWFPRVQKMRW